MSADPSDVAELVGLCAELAGDETRVAIVLVRRLLEGQRRYGALDIASDARDWRREAAEEFADMIIYDAIDIVARELAMPRRREP